MKLVPNKTQQNMAKKTQNAESVTKFSKVIDSQNSRGMNWPPQNTALFNNAGTLLSSD